MTTSNSLLKRVTELILILCLSYEIPSVYGISAVQDLTLTLSEKRALDEFKSRVENDVPNDYMKTEVYLARWIRGAGKNVDNAERLFRENLKWRAEYKMDNILKEDFSEMEKEFPIDLDGVDFTGRPVLVVNVGEWDVRRSHIQGLHEENYRYSMRALELASEKVREAQSKGKLVTRFQVIFNLDGFNIVSHACLQCIPPYLKFINAMQNYFPEMIDNIIFINAPQSLESVLKFIRPIARPSLRKLMKIFGTNKKEWQSYLLKLIPRDQLDARLGGTRVVDLE